MLTNDKRERERERGREKKRQRGRIREREKERDKSYLNEDGKLFCFILRNHSGDLTNEEILQDSK